MTFGYEDESSSGIVFIKKIKILDDVKLLGGAALGGLRVGPLIMVIIGKFTILVQRIVILYMGSIERVQDSLHFPNSKSHTKTVKNLDFSF